MNWWNQLLFRSFMKRALHLLKIRQLIDSSISGCSSVPVWKMYQKIYFPIVLSRLSVLKLITEVSVSYILCSKYKNVISMYAVNKVARCHFFSFYLYIFLYRSLTIFQLRISSFHLLESFDLHRGIQNYVLRQARGKEDGGLGKFQSYYLYLSVQGVSWQNDIFKMAVKGTKMS